MKNNEIKDKIIRETKSLLQKQRTVTIKDIADKCYMNIASVNYYFGSKEFLIQQVVSEVIEELKTKILHILYENKGKSKSVVLEEMIGFTYTYALENIGILSYLFLNQDMQQTSSNLLVDTFFSDNDFTRLIFKEITLSNQAIDQQTLYAQYMIMFSSFCMPLFISISNKDNSKQLETFKDDKFRAVFIKELLRVIEG
ncbi:MAG: TetR/AcrR family transcriptional regulator [Acholeplasma sp.]|jgi:AcrR family transcriptional regulator|nr:TetR/AcrR family transcriptional regulator [Acholeplasma sp.]